MKLNFLEKAAVNNPLRARMLSRVVRPLLHERPHGLAGLSILEIGCGQGAGTQILLARGHADRVFAFDYDPTQLARTRRRLGRRQNGAVSLFVGDAEHLPFPNRSFDVIVEFAVLHHLNDWRGALREIARVLKPGGTLLYEEFLKAFTTAPVIRQLFDHPTTGWFTADQFTGALRDTGFVSSGPQRRFYHWWLTGTATLP
ncbi:MAG: class I SAM-dependent methyltransferase [Candidatus Hydrogenedentes bacterium]|nr:class I SAM-dependent methyltransferase [Candidatus Hydrogenedentota bacterium]